MKYFHIMEVGDLLYTSEPVSIGLQEFQLKKD